LHQLHSRAASRFFFKFVCVFRLLQLLLLLPCVLHFIFFEQDRPRTRTPCPEHALSCHIERQKRHIMQRSILRSFSGFSFLFQEHLHRDLGIESFLAILPLLHQTLQEIVLFPNVINRGAPCTTNTAHEESDQVNSCRVMHALETLTFLAFLIHQVFGVGFVLQRA